MCTWVSACSVGDGKLLYFPKHLRDRIKEGTLWDYADTNLINDPDSHSQICAYYGVSVDQVHKYEFRPMDRQFIVDSVCGSLPMDRNQIETKMRRVDCRRLAPPELIFKKIVHPFKLPFRKPTKQDLSLLQKWDSVRASVRDSVGDSVWDSVRYSVGAYISSFFNLKKWKYIDHREGENPFQCCIDLWEKGLVPSFDGKTWRLHAGRKAKIVYEISEEDLMKEGE